MSRAKAFLKAAKAAIEAHNFVEAVEQSQKAIEADQGNYHARVFLGLALGKQDQDAASEKAYKAAINIKENDILAWQGLVTLYEKRAGKSLEDYHGAAVRLAELYMQQDDKTRCQAVIDKYTSHAEKYGSKDQLKRSLEVLLPGGPVFDYLGSRLPQPAHTYSTLADIAEVQEKENINSEIGQRRTRLGARIDQVTLEVKREVLGASSLEKLYVNVIDWSHDDEVRRHYEEKLLQHALDTLAALPMTMKAAKRKEVTGMAQGLVILKHPFLLAWRIVLEWNDLEDIGSLDSNILRDYIKHFPEDGLGKLIRGYVTSEASPFAKGFFEDETGADNDNNGHAMPPEERLILMTEGLQEASESMLAHRLMGQYYLYLEEYESAVGTLNTGLKRVATESKMIGLHLTQIEDAMNTMLATALIQYQSPRHHSEARNIFEGILKRKPTSTSALIGIGMILEEDEEYPQALDFLQRALERRDDVRIRAETAWCKALTGDSKSSLHELNACLTDMEGSDMRTRSLRSQTLYRIGMCMWSLDDSRSARKDRKGAYARFLASVQTDMNFAPAYTSLGIYYADYARDRKRATKCFHKAFELSAAETEAAHRLAQAFAETGEWDLVEVVAQRVIESGKVRPPPGSKKKAISWPFAALGAVQLDNQEYAKSIVSFQSALRNSPHNYYCWVGLGESYHYAGRYIAATKAFEYAQGLEGTPRTDSGWFTEYMLANVKRELGQYEEAVSGYQHVLRSKPREFGVCIALVQTLVEGAWRSIQLGFFGRAVDGACEAINASRDVVDIKANAYSLWKAVGDACSIYGVVRSCELKLPDKTLRCLLTGDCNEESFGACADLDHVGGELLYSSSEDVVSQNSRLPFSLTAALLAHKRAIAASAQDIHARAVAWYNLGWTEHLAHTTVMSIGIELHTSEFLKASVHCFKRAIELEAGNSEFWNSLGIVTCDLSPKVSQHAFVRSLYLNEKSPRVWANLGALYLLKDDCPLAQEAFIRSRSADPAYSQGWLGQGLIAKDSNDISEARQLFTQAFEIADTSNILTKTLYTTSMFDRVASNTMNTSDLLQPLLSLHHLAAILPADLPSQHLSSLFAERVSNFDNAESTLERVCSSLEADYEVSESAATLLRFAQAKADLARVELAQRKFEMAAENASMALDLSDDEDQSVLRERIRLSAHMTAGLAHFHLASMDQAIEMFKGALSGTHGNADIICLLSQVLWARGGESEQEVAREQLLDCIERYPEHVGATALLGCIASLDNDQDTIDAMVADLQSLRTKDGLGAMERGRVVQLLTLFSSLRPGSGEEYGLERSQINSTIVLAPSKPEGWRQLAEISTETFPAELAVVTATKAVPPHGPLEPKELCQAYAGTRRADDAQRAIMIAPFCEDGWESLW